MSGMELYYQQDTSPLTDLLDTQQLFLKEPNMYSKQIKDFWHNFGIFNLNLAVPVIFFICTALLELHFLFWYLLGRLQIVKKVPKKACTPI